MRMRKLLAVAGAVVALAATQPASADDHTVVGANAGLAGFVAATYEEPADGARTNHTYRVSTKCTFAGVLTPANTLIVEYGGAAVAHGPAGRTTPLLTAVKCEIRNSTESQSREVALNGSASAVADSTALATSGPKEWAVENVTICASAFAIWGPTPVRVVTVPLSCQTPG